eukprot:gene5944-4602_t
MQTSDLIPPPKKTILGPESRSNLGLRTDAGSESWACGLGVRAPAGEPLRVPSSEAARFLSCGECIAFGNASAQLAAPFHAAALPAGLRDIGCDDECGVH